MAHSKTSQKSAQATFVDTSDGHGSQFEIHLDNGAKTIPPEMLSSIKAEFGRKATLYVDGVRIEGNKLIFSLCRGSIVLAKVDHRYNHERRDEKFHVIMREEMETEDNPLFPQFEERP